MAEPTKWAELWRDLCEKDDRTSPEDYPDMALITEDELYSLLDEARRRGIEEAARIADGGRELVELRGEIGFVAAYRFAADLAKDIADGIRALATKEPTDG